MECVFWPAVDSCAVLCPVKGRLAYITSVVCLVSRGTLKSSHRLSEWKEQAAEWDECSVRQGKSVTHHWCCSLELCDRDSFCQKYNLMQLYKWHAIMRLMLLTRTPSAYSAPGTPPANRTSFVGVTPRDPGGLYQAQVGMVYLTLSSLI